MFLSESSVLFNYFYLILQESHHFYWELFNYMLCLTGLLGMNKSTNTESGKSHLYKNTVTSYQMDIVAGKQTTTKRY